MNFDVNFQQSDTATVHTAHLIVPGTPTTTLTQLPASPDYTVTETGPPAPWSLRSIVCDTYTLTPGAQFATPVTINLVTNGVPTGLSLPLVPPAYIPAGSNLPQCTVTDEAPSLTLVKLVNSDARPSPTATPDMWTLQATGPQSVSVPGSSTGVTTIVAPGTYALSEIRTPGNLPPSFPTPTAPPGAVTAPRPPRWW